MCMCVRATPWRSSSIATRCEGVCVCVCVCVRLSFFLVNIELLCMQAQQVLPGLVDSIPEARLNLVSEMIATLCCTALHCKVGAQPWGRVV